MTEANIVIEDIAGLNKVVKHVHISGQLDESNVDEKIQAIYKIFETTPKGVNIIFDLENLDYMNSKSIGYLTDLYGKVTESGGTVAIAKPKPNITDILQVVGLTQLIKTFDSIEEAKKYISDSATVPVVAPAPAAPAPVTTPAPVAVETPVVPAPAPAISVAPAIVETPAAPAPTAPAPSVTTTPAAVTPAQNQ
ncbi:MAG: STAS domain-containing protein [Candidatus Peregrinibacteria bacterium]|nr:STAS domain-containing protein [Candidatus Peregrinibacteria bacterium]